MTARTWLVSGLFAVAIGAGTFSDRARASVSTRVGGYDVLAADFHVHAFPQTWSTLAPWDTVIEAGHQGLDLIAIVPHDRVLASKVGRWFARLIGGPIVLTGEEITTPGYHMLGLGLTDTVATNLSAADAIREVHRQGGVAIAAHPYASMWPAYDRDALAILDGAEVVRPETPNSEAAAAQLLEFFQKAPVAAIGSSDYHGMGVMGYARTLVFATGRSEVAILDALRAHRTVVYDRDHVYGDPAMIALAAQQPSLNAGFPTLPVPGAWRLVSRIAGVLGMALLVLTRGKS